MFIESSIPPTRGGIQRVTWILSKYLIAHGYNVFFAFWFKNSSEVDEYHKIKIGNNGRIYKKHMDDLYRFVQEKNIGLIINQQTQGYITRFLKRIKDDTMCKIVYCLHLSPNFGDYNFNIKYIAINCIYKLFVKIDYCSLQERKQYMLADRYVLLSQTFISDFLRRTKISDANKLRWISNPLSFPISNDKLYKHKQVLIISRMQEQQKNLSSALRIWKEIENKGYSQWHLVLGGYGPDEQMILNYSKSLGVKRMIFLGKINDPIPLYKESSIFMMTSNYEGFGMVLTEALQFGCVPVAFDTFTALHDILIDGYNGYIIPSKDEKKYVEKLECLMNNDEVLQKMSLHARKSCEKFKIENIGKQWLDLFNEL